MINYEIDSRLIKKGDTFVAIKGHTVDGHDFIDQAIKNGASEIITEKKLNDDINHKIVNDSQKYLNDILVNKYSKLFKDLTLIGITGTNGKTTTGFITYQILNKLNINTAYIGTLGFHYNGLTEELNNTTPDILTLYKLLLKAKNNNVTHVVLEVSSHAIDLNRVEGLSFDVGAFTNLSQDHLDYHKTLDNYLKTKLKLVQYLKTSGTLVVNGDDLNSKKFEFNKIKSIGFDADYKIINTNILPNETTLTFEFNNKIYNVKYKLTNMFNTYNYLMAFAIVNSLGINEEKIINATDAVTAPRGRCETIKINHGYAVVDFAHAPGALEKVLESYNEVKQNRIITVVGCGGDRDKTKRPIMGKIASDLSDYVIFTSDNPRTEDPESIINEIIEGVDKSNYEVDIDRKKAIKKAIGMMEKGDIVMVLGKGHETEQIIGREKFHFDDLEEIKNWNKS